MHVSVIHIYIFINVFLHQIRFIHNFGYSRLAQLQWRKDSDHCGGNLQSPIVLNSTQAIEIGMPALETIRYHNLLPDELTLQNNGHSIALSITKTPNCHDYDIETPYIFGALLQNEYIFEGLHFHWGARNNRGSEHILDDIRYPMEMHLIHRNKKYNDLQTSLKHSDGLTVLGIFFQLRDDRNIHLDPLLHHFKQIKNYKQSLNLNSSFALTSLMPHNIDRFYTYKGSLTTPPCSEVVTWIIFANTIPISSTQLNEFRTISTDTTGHLLVDNYRYVQPIGHRKVYLRQPKMKHIKYFSNANFLKWNWFSTQDNLIDF